MQRVFYLVAPAGKKEKEKERKGEGVICLSLIILKIIFIPRDY